MNSRSSPQGIGDDHLPDQSADFARNGRSSSARTFRSRESGPESLHFNVTEHPTAAWVVQQIVEAFADRETPCYLVRDRDGVYGTEVRTRLKSMGIADVLTAPQSPGRIRRAIDRIDTTGVFESFHHSEQSAFEENAGSHISTTTTDRAPVWRSANNTQLSARSWKMARS
jgi:hypothetical protein